MKVKSISSQKERIIYYDLIKILSAFMVCFYHLGMLDMGYSNNSIYIPNLNKMIMNFCSMSVPLFFMVNGALLLRKKYSLKEILYKFIKTIFIYCAWSVIIYVITSMLLGEEISMNIRILLFGGKGYTIHLWFLRTIAILTLLSPILKKIYDNESKKVLYSLIVLLLIFPFIYNYIVLIGRYFKIQEFNNLNRTGLFTMYSIVYFILGKLLSDILQSNKIRCKFKLLSILSIFIGWVLVTIEVTLWTNIDKSVFDGVNASFPTIGALFMAMGTFCLVSQVELDKSIKVKKTVEIIGVNIMGIYLFHNTLIILFRNIVNANIPIILSVFIVLIIMTITLLITILLNKVPIVNKLLNI